MIDVQTFMDYLPVPVFGTKPSLPRNLLSTTHFEVAWLVVELPSHGGQFGTVGQPLVCEWNQIFKNVTVERIDIGQFLEPTNLVFG